MKYIILKSIVISITVTLEWKYQSSGGREAIVVTTMLQYVPYLLAPKFPIMHQEQDVFCQYKLSDTEHKPK